MLNERACLPRSQHLSIPEHRLTSTSQIRGFGNSLLSALPATLLSAERYNLENKLTGIHLFFNRTQDAEVERIAKRALGTRAVLVRALRRPVAPARPAKGIASSSTDEVLTLAVPAECSRFRCRMGTTELALREA